MKRVKFKNDKIAIILSCLILVLGVLNIIVVNSTKERDMLSLKQEDEDVIKKLMSDNEDNPESTKYLVTDKYISRVAPSTDISEFKKNLKGDVSVYKDESCTKEVTTGYIKSNMFVKYNDNGRVFKVSVVGDLNGDGILNQIELTKIIKNIVDSKKYQITDDIEKLSADINCDGVINQEDTDKIIKYIVYGSLDIPEVNTVKKPELGIIDGLKQGEVYISNVRVKIKEEEENAFKTIYRVSTKDDRGNWVKIDSEDVVTIREDGIYKVEAYTYGILGNKSSNSNVIIVKDETQKKIPAPEVTITHTPVEWTKENVTVTIKDNSQNLDDSLILQYCVVAKTGEVITDYTTYENPFEVDRNSQVKVRYTDGKNVGEEVTHDILNIDKVNPKIASVNGLNIISNSFDLEIKGKDEESGISKIRVYVNDELNKTFEYEENSTEEKIEKYTLNNLTSNTKYNVYIEVEDKVGNIKSTKDNIKEITTKNVPDLNATITHTPTEWTKEDVTVTITTNKSIPNGYVLQYAVFNEDGNIVENWKNYEEPFKVENNGKVKARITDGQNFSNEVSHDITNIDKVNPKVASVDVNNILSNSFDLNIKGKDEESGISKIRVYVNNELKKTFSYTNNLNSEKQETYSLDNLLSNTKYSVYIEVEDKVGNVKSTKDNALNVVTDNMPEGNEALEIISTPTEWTKGNVSVTINKKVEIKDNVYVEYSIYSLDGNLEKDYTRYNSAFNVTHNCKIKARLTDGKNIGTDAIHDITNIDKTNPVLAQTAISKVTQNSFSLDIKGKDNESGVFKIRVYVNNELKNTYNYSDNLNEEKQEVFGLDNLAANTSYKYYIEVEDLVGNITSTKDLDLSVTTTDMPTLDVTISHTPVEWTKENVNVTITPNADIADGFTLQYAIVGLDGTKIKDYSTYTSTFEVDKNSQIKARLTDGKNVSNERTHDITNIDKTNPVLASVEASNITTKSAILTVKGKDNESGISKIRVYVNNELKKTFEYEGNSTEEKSENYTLNDLTQNTKYSVYIEVEDKVGNITSTEDKKLDITTPKVPDLDAVISHTPTEWTKEDVTVTITPNMAIPQGLNIEYSLVNGSGDTLKEYTTYENPFSVDNNCKVVARYTDGTNHGNTIEHEITNIDKVNPKVARVNVQNVKTNSFELNIAGKDEESGISKVRVYVNDELKNTYEYTGKSVEEKSQVYKVENLTQNTEYSAYIEVEDSVGNITSTNESKIIITTPKVPDLDAVISHTPTNWTNKDVTVTITPSTTIPQGKNIEYSLVNNSGETLKEYAIYENLFKVDKNCKIVARLTDGTNAGNTIEHEITNIDKIAPKIAYVTSNNVTTNSFDLSINGKDEESGISKIRVYVNNELKETFSYTENLNEEKQETYSLSNLTQSTQYAVYIEVEDIATNIHSTKDNPLVVTTDSIPVGGLNITHTPTDWTNQNVDVTIAKEDEQNTFDIEYAIFDLDNVKLQDYTTYEDSFEVDKNCKILARLTDGKNKGEESTHFVTNIDKVNPKVANITSSDITTNSLKLNVSGKDEESGIAKINVYVNDELKKSYEYSNNLTEEKNETLEVNDLIQNTTYSCYIEVIDRATNKTITPVKNVKTAAIQDIDTIVSSITHTPTEWTKENVTVTINLSKEVPVGLTLQYQVVDTNNHVLKDWTTYEAPFEVEQNGRVKARLTDGKNVGNEITHDITNIDKVNPVLANVTLGEVNISSFNITLKGKDEESGISKIRVYLNDELVKTFSYTGNSTEEKQENYTLENLKQNTNYSVYMEIEDVAGNISSTSDDKLQVTTGKMPELNASITHTPTSWTNEDVTVTITPNVTGYTLEYKLVDNTGADITEYTTYSTPFNVSSNAIVKCRLTDGKNVSNENTHEIKNIDKVDPNTALVEANDIRSDGFTLNITAKDNESGVKNIKVYVLNEANEVIRSKIFSYDGNSIGDEKVDSKEESYVVTDIDQSTKYKYYIEVIDSASNKVTTERKEVTTVSVPDISANIITTPTDWTNGNVNVEIVENLSHEGYKVEYSVENLTGSKITDWTDYTSNFDVTQNCVIKARLTDGINHGNVISANVKNIDKTNPSANITVSSLKTNSFILDLSSIDTQSGIKNVNVYVSKKGEEGTIATKEYTYDINSVEDAKTVTKTENFEVLGLEQNTTYIVYMTVVDGANNEFTTDTKREITTGNVPSLDANIVHTPTSWTNNEVTVSINSNSTQEGYTKKYKIEDKDGNVTKDYDTYVNPFTISQNSVIKARLTDGLNNGTELTHEVNNIDKVNPSKANISVDESKTTMNSFSLNVEGEDENSGLKEIRVYVKAEGEENYSATKYEYDGNAIGDEKVDNSTIVTKVDQAISDTNYECYLEVEDQAGNISRSSTVTLRTEKFPDLDATISHTPADWTNQDVDVEITINSTLNDGVKVKYQVIDLDNNVLQEYTDYTGTFKVSKNSTVYAKATDGKNSSNVIEHKIENIDKEPPVITNVSIGEEMSMSQDVTIKATDNNGIVAYGISNDIDTEPEYTSCEATKDLDTKLTVNKNGVYYVFVKDVASNISTQQITVENIYTDVVARIGDTLYPTLKLAIEACPENAGDEKTTIEILKDINETNIVIDGKNVIIDLKGYTISSSIEGVPTITNHGILQIVDSSEAGTGKIVSTKSEAILNETTGTFILGLNDSTISKEYPVIEGKAIGVNNKGSFEFYDGKLIGDIAINGEVNVTPDRYNTMVETTDNRQSATLGILADVEARIGNKYYVKLAQAVEDVKAAGEESNPTTITILKTINLTETLNIEANKNIAIDLDGNKITTSKEGHLVDNYGKLEIRDSKQNITKKRIGGGNEYFFEEQDGKYVSNNTGVQSSVANGYMKIDLSNKEGTYLVNVNAKISSEANCDIGYARITESEEILSFDNETGRFMYISGDVGDTNYSKILEGGKTYYLHLGYRKDGSGNTGEDKLTINSISLSKYVNSPKLGQIQNSDDYFFEEQDGKYVSNNTGKDNSVANSYFKIDLTGKGETVVNVNSKISSEANYDIGYARITESEEILSFDNESGRFMYISGNVNDTDYSKLLEGGKIYYLHLGYRKDGGTNTGEDKLTINSISLYLNDSDGRVDVSEYIDKNIEEYQILNDNRGTLSGTSYNTIYNYNGSKLKVNGGTITSNTTKLCTIYGEENTTIDVLDGYITGYNGAISTKGIVNISGGNLSATNCTLQILQSDDKSTITGGTINSSDDYGISNSGILDITGGNITNTHYNSIENKDSGNVLISGITIKGVNNSGYLEMVNSTSTSYISNRNNSTAKITNSTMEDYITNNGSLEINGGNVNSYINNNDGSINIDGVTVGGSISSSTSSSNNIIKNSTIGGTISNNKNGIIRVIDCNIEVKGIRSNINYYGIENGSTGIVDIEGNTNINVSGSGTCIGLGNTSTGTINIGKNDSEILTTNPIINSKDYGIKNLNGNINYYDGVLNAQTAILGNVSKIPDGSEINIEIIDSNQRATLKEKIEPVASVAGVEYMNLQDAINACTQIDNNITILRDFSAVSAQEVAVIPANKDIVMNLNSHTIYSYSVNNIITNNGTLTINDNTSEKSGKIVSGTILNEENSTFNLYGGTIVSNIGGSAKNESGIYSPILNYGTINVKDATIQTTAENTAGIKNMSNGTINMISGNITGYTTIDTSIGGYGIYNTSNNEESINISGGEIIASTALQNNNLGNITISNATLSGVSRDAVISNLKSGNITLNKVRVTNTEAQTALKNSGGNISILNNSELLGYNNCITNISGTITIENSKISGGSSVITNSGTVYLKSGEVSASSSYAIKNTGTFTIGDDTNEEVSITNPSISAKYEAISNSNVLNFYDGIVRAENNRATFNGNVTKIPKNYEIYKTNEGGIETAILKKADPVASIGDKTYMSVNEAIDDCEANTNTTIKILRNIDLISQDEQIVVDEDKDVTIDLNSKNITGVASPLFNNIGKLEITDNSEEGAGKINASGNAIINHGELVTITKGNITANASTTIDNVSTGEVRINGGTITNNSGNSSTYIVNNASTGLITVNDGTITRKRYYRS